MNFLFLTIPILLSSNPTANTESSCTASVVNAKAPAQNIVETAVSAGQFKTLVAALGAGSLDSVLQGNGPFTVFAPTDAAFSALPEGTVKTLLKPENKDKLVSVLTYHVVSGKVMAADVTGMKKAKTVQGSELKIKVKKGEVYIDKAKVVATDIETSNGVIHIIDTVVIPKA